VTGTVTKNPSNKAAFVVSILALAGCEIVAGIKKRPLVDGRGGSTGQAGTGGPTGTGGQAGRGGSVGGGGAGGSAVAQNGAPCSAIDARACAGHNAAQKLLCGPAGWGPNGECSSAERCDTRPGSTAGTCIAIVPECTGKQPGDHVCVGMGAVHACGPDLLTTELTTTCSHPMPECSYGTCTCLGTKCDGVCAHLDSDRANCGACGHTCDGECVRSRCRLTLATVPQTAVQQRGVAVDETNAYWTNPDNGSVMSVPLRGGDFVVVATTTDAGGGPIAVDGARVYWLTTNATWSAPKGGVNQSATQISGLGGGRGIAVDATSVYFTSRTSAVFAVNRIGLDGTSPVELARTFLSGGLAKMDDRLFWTENGVPWTIPASGGSPMMVTIPVTNSAQASGQVAVDAASMYWVVMTTGSRILMKSTLTLQNPTTLATASNPGAAGPSSVVVDEQATYWTGGLMNLMRTGLAGENPTTIASDLLLAGGMAIDASNLYVTTTNGQIIKIEK
jgi:hypothetical protein